MKVMIEVDLTPDTNSSRFVARILRSVMTEGTRQIILRDGPEAVKALDQFTQGFASLVRDELLRILWGEDS